MTAKPEPLWIERIAAGHAPRLRNPGESTEDYRIAMGWDQPKVSLEANLASKLSPDAVYLREALALAEEVMQCRNVRVYAQHVAARAHNFHKELRAHLGRPAGVTPSGGDHG